MQCFHIAVSLQRFLTPSLGITGIIDDQNSSEKVSFPQSEDTVFKHIMKQTFFCMYQVHFIKTLSTCAIVVMRDSTLESRESIRIEPLPLDNFHQPNQNNGTGFTYVLVGLTHFLKKCKKRERSYVLDGIDVILGSGL